MKFPAFLHRRLAIAFVAASFASAITLYGQSRSVLTAHVPAAVASGQAALLGPVPADQRLSLAISLPLRNEATLDNFLSDLYDPQSPVYRRYLTVDQFTASYGPTAADYAALISFAESNGFTVQDTMSNRLVLDVEAPASTIQQVFHISLNQYAHPTENRTFYAPDAEPTLNFAVPVLHITGLDNFTLPTPKNIRPGAPFVSPKATGSGPHGQFIGSDMRAAYYGSGPLTGVGQTVGLFEFAGYEVSDVQLYFSTVNQSLNVPINGVSVNGASLKCPPSSCDDGEQVLDIEIAISMAPGLDQVLVYVGKSGPSIFSRMASDNVAKQVSVSWGFSYDQSTIDPIFKQMSAQGQTVFVATGDSGSSTPGSVTWPSDDPYVVAVGGTDLVTDGPGGAWKSETGWSGSAGMPSKNKVPIPGYQKLAGVITNANQGSTTLRNIPDVAAEANTNQFSCYDGRCYGGNGGTSYASPMWAGFFALANQQIVANGGTTIGLFNPALYRIGVNAVYSSDFHDTVGGSNGKYTAVTGFDLVAGWGSMVGPDLIKTLAAIY